MSRTPEWKAWHSIKDRCLNEDAENYPRYGGRGISVHPAWLAEPGGFESFFAEVGLRPSTKHSLERKENGGNYEPGNVVWATAKEQANNRRTNRVVEFEGERLTLAQWAERKGISADTLFTRLVTRRWSTARALLTPARSYRRAA